VGEKIFDEVIIEHIRNYRKDPFLKAEGGSKVLSKYLYRDHNVIVNHKKVARICRKEGLLIKKRKKKKTKFGKMAANHKITRPNQVWEFDIKYGYLHGEKRFYFLIAYIDVFTRKIKGWHLGYRCQAIDLATTLKAALKEGGIIEEDQLIIRSDNGPQMRADLFKEELKELPVDHEFIPLRTPNKNAHIESFFSIYDKHMQGQYFWTFKDAYQWSLEFMNFYNEDRIHGSLGMSPSLFASKEELHDQGRFMQSI
jgi:putative transposase